MKKTILSLLLTLIAISTANATGNIEAGKTKSAMCAACHGTDGNSLVPMYPKLAGQNAKYMTKQLADFKKGVTSGGSEGRVDSVMGGMTMALNEQDMLDLSAYYASQSISKGNGKTTELGKKLYFGGDAEREMTACIACHGVNGEGMENAGFPGVANQNSEYLKAQLIKFKDATRTNDINSMMQNIAIKLEDADIAALSQYMSSLN